MTEKSPVQDVLSRPIVYGSKVIHERRKRILREARRLIAEKGIEGFSVRELGTRSEVALRTLYNAFYSKDYIIALAIREAFDDVHRHTQYSTDIKTIEGIIDRLITVNRRNFKSKNYTRAVCALYFSPTTTPEVWDALQAMALMNLSVWLDAVQEKGEFHEWVVVPELAKDIAMMEFAIINDWANGRISDKNYLPRLVVGMLRVAVGCIRGNTKTEVEAYLRQICVEKKLPSFPNPTWSSPQ